MSNCQNCGTTTYNGKRWCPECEVEETAPDLTSEEDHECPDCGGRTSGEGVTCATCRRVDEIVGEFEDYDDPVEVTE